MQEYINPRVTLNHIGRVTSQKNWGMREHVHTDFHEFILVLRGSLKVRIRGMTLVGQRGDVLYYPARGENCYNTLLFADKKHCNYFLTR